MYLPYWDNLDSLTPLQNEWLKKYTRPNAMVIMPQWAMNQPKGFKLDYLLKHVLENGWDLTEAGWAKAHAMGISQGMELTEEVEEEGLKHSKAADLLYKANLSLLDRLSSLAPEAPKSDSAIEPAKPGEPPASSGAN